MRYKNIQGQKFGMLTTTSFNSISPGKARLAIWNCVCDCGVETTVYGSALRNGTTASCGCDAARRIAVARTTHGMTNTSTYNSWKSMLARCGNPNDPYYGDYGGRGISVCAAWRESFDCFLQDMGERPDETTIDRENNDGNYEPSNCRWATIDIQKLNKRSAKPIFWNGTLMSRADFSRMLGLSRGAMNYWMERKGFTPQQVAQHFTTVTKDGGKSTVTGALCDA